MEWTLQQQGFDFCYDKRLYDRLAHESAESVRGHLQADAAYQERLLRFIENHDEPRAAATFGAGQARAAAVVMSTLQGARLYHDGQLEGRRTHIPVFLGRGPDEPPDDELRAFYAAAAARGRRRRPARRRLAAVRLRRAGPTTTRTAGWSRGAGAPADSRHLVVVNLSDAPAQARVRLPWDDLAGRTWQLTRPLDGRALRARRRRAGRRRPVRRPRRLGVELPRVVRRRLTGRASCSQDADRLRQHRRARRRRAARGAGALAAPVAPRRGGDLEAAPGGRGGRGARA